MAAAGAHVGPPESREGYRERASIQYRHHRGGGMDRRAFLELLAAAPLASAVSAPRTRRPPTASSAATLRRPCPACPAPGRAAWCRVRSPRCLDEAGVVVDADVVREMMDRGMRALTGEATTLGAWRRFFEPSDVVGIKVNAGGVPHVVSNPAIVAETCRQLMAVGVPPSQHRRLRALPEPARRDRLPGAPPGGRRRSSRPRPATGARRTAPTTPRPTSRWTSSARRTRART